MNQRNEQLPSCSCCPHLKEFIDIDHAVAVEVHEVHHVVNVFQLARIVQMLI